MVAFWWLAAKALASKAMSTPVQDMSGGADMPDNHPEVGGGGSGLIRKAASAYLGGGGAAGAAASAGGGREGGDISGRELDLTAGGGKAGSGVNEGAMQQMGGDSPYVGESQAPIEPGLAGQLSQENDPSYMRSGMAALAGYHQGGVMGAVEGWHGSIDQQQTEYERKLKRRFYGNAAQGAGGL